jgi:hypothetical protein
MAATVLNGMRVKKAVRWISDSFEIEESPDLRALIREAIARFDLSPLEGDNLYRFYEDIIGEQQKESE